MTGASDSTVLRFDRKVGSVELGDVRLAAGLAEPDFLAQVPDATPVVINAPWASYEFDRGEWGCVAQFKSGALVQIRLSHVMPGDEQGWRLEDDRDVRRKAIHDAVVKSWVGWWRRRFSWGRLESSRDLKGGSVSILVTYPDCRQ